MHKILYNQFHVFTTDRGLGCHGCKNCQNANKKKKFRPPTGDALYHEMEQAIAGWNESDARRNCTLLEVHPDHIIYTEYGKTMKRSFSFNQYGTLIFSIDSEVTNYQQFLKEIATRAVQHLINQVERSYDMKKEENILLPASLTVNATNDSEAEEKEIQALRDEADKKGILLPSQFNVTGTKEVKKEEAGNILLPTGQN